MAATLLTRFPAALGALSKLTGFSAANSGALGFANMVSGVATGVCMFTSAVAGQETGGVLNFVDGFVDVSEEKYYENGGAESGTVLGALGNLANSAAITGYTIVRNTPKYANQLLKIIPGFGQVSKAIDLGLLAWQGTSLADEVFRGDGDVFKDKFDILGNVISIVSLMALFKGGLGGKALSKIGKKGGGGAAGVIKAGSPYKRPPGNNSGLSTPPRPIDQSWRLSLAV